MVGGRRGARHPRLRTEASGLTRVVLPLKGSGLLPTTIRCRGVRGGPGWEVEIWTFRLSSLPGTAAWRDPIGMTLSRLLAAGCGAAWLAAQEDFVDPPDLFDPSCMGEGVYAGLSEATGLLFHDAKDSFETLSDDELSELKKTARNVWE